MESLLDIIKSKRTHVVRLANRNGAEGEIFLAEKMADWLPRPKGKALQVLLSALRESGIIIKRSSFDAIALPSYYQIDFSDLLQVKAALPLMNFIEIKSANQSRVKPGFEGFFFALTESEISAADQLGVRHVVVLYNKLTEEVLFTSVTEIMARAKSSTWQVSIQL